MKKKTHITAEKKKSPCTHIPHRHTKNTVLVRKIIGLLREYTEEEITMLAEKYLEQYPPEKRKIGEWKRRKTQKISPDKKNVSRKSTKPTLN